jgi:hypothetical protein
MWCRGGVGGIGYERCPGGCATSSPRGDEEEEADVDVSRQEPNGRGPCDRVNTQGVGPACQRMFSRGST